VLYALTYHPTGAIVAAPTTSHPEVRGGSRNWDYRYAWVRDASFTLHALCVAACPHEAYRFFEFIADAAASCVQESGDLQIMFGIGGERDLTERELDHLTGWHDSTPVRIGNDAWNQRQLDVYGEVLDAALRLPDQLDQLGPGTRRFLADLADTADHPRMRATIDATAERLTDERGLVFRYLATDDLHGRAPRQLPAGVQPHRTRPRRLGHRRGGTRARGRTRARRALTPARVLARSVGYANRGQLDPTPTPIAGNIPCGGICSPDRRDTRVAWRLGRWLDTNTRRTTMPSDRRTRTRRRTRT
jgi:hypothetical protein